MKVKDATKWIVINQTASSLFDVIAGGTKTTTTVGKDTWKSLIAGSSLQDNCNDEGFNLKCEASDVYTHVRLGFLANNENDCDTCDSYIGLGVHITAVISSLARHAAISLYVTMYLFMVKTLTFQHLDTFSCSNEQSF